ncbi:hypothetical protein [Pseudooceanicola sp.]|uniref:hypothetical protein n=1 Tax=Pseudooceanicola sp. TaxID=1914328 RepID=UPI0040591D7D
MTAAKYIKELSYVRCTTSPLPVGVIGASIQSVKRYRCFFRIEARVTLILRSPKTGAISSQTILTSVPITLNRPGYARRKLIASATMLANAQLPAFRAANTSKKAA